MTKVPFDIKYRPQIESGEYKVETVKGFPAEILKYDANHKYAPIIFSYIDDTGEYTAQTNGKDLLIVTPEEELTDWEKAVGIVLTDYQLLPRDKDGIANIHDINEFTKKKAAELLSLAREQFIKDGYIIEKKVFHDAVEKVSPEVMKEVSKNVDAMNEALHLEHEKDLELTWEDMAKIDAIIMDVNNEFAIDISKEISRQKFYETVLKRFNELKE